MIVSSDGLRAVAALEGAGLWTYDRRRRRTAVVDPTDGRPFLIREGTGAFALLERVDGGARVTVRDVREPLEVLASADLDADAWRFAGDNRQWARVPEHVLLVDGDHRRLARLADDAAVVDISELGPVHQVEMVPGSRLVVLAGPGALSVFDPVAGRELRHLQLAGGEQHPLVRFRNGEELWVNDVDTMLKIETRQWQVVDAAGSETAEGAEPRAIPVDPEPVAAGEAEDATASAGRFGGWTWAGDGELCVVSRPGTGDVLVLDAVSMLPVAHGLVGGAPIDAALLGRNLVVAVEGDGGTRRSRARRVRIRTT